MDHEVFMDIQSDALAGGRRRETTKNTEGKIFVVLDNLHIINIQGIGIHIDVLYFLLFFFLGDWFNIIDLFD